MNTIATNSFRAWILAARPKTLTGALVPVIIGSALAFAYGSFVWKAALLCALFASLMQIAANFINDLFDFLKGSDREDRLGPERACAQGWITPPAMRKGILFTVLLACLCGLMLISFGGWKLIFIGIACVALAFFYTTGPYPLSYYGWGDALVILCFGFIPVCGTFYVQALTLTPEVWVAALSCGLVVDTLLVVNNYRDREADKKSGKRTLVVRFGEGFGRYLYLALGYLAVVLCIWFMKDGHLYAAVLPFIYLIPHTMTWRKMVKIHQGKKLNSILGETSRNMLLMALLLSAGIVLSIY